MTNKFETMASELPILDEKGKYRYLEEVADQGKYQQVAWQKVNDEYIALYGTEPIQLPTSDDLITEFPEETED